MTTHPTHHAKHEPHACPFWIIATVFAALLVFTALTVYTATEINLGEYNLILAMAIAVIKALLVALFFMHLWWDSLFNGIAILAGAAFLALFIGFSTTDTYQYEPDVQPLGDVLTPEKIAATAITVETHAAEPSHEPATDPETGSHEQQGGAPATDPHESDKPEEPHE